MWHIEIFNARCKAAEMEAYFREEALPYFRSRGFGVHFFCTQHELGPKDFWFLTEAPNFADLDLWPERATGEARGAAVMDGLLDRIAGSPRASVAAEVMTAGAGALRWDACPMWHVELFNGAGRELESTLRDEVLPYWRSRGFTAHLLSTQLGLGPRQFWLLTGMERFGSIDGWEQQALGESRGRELMARINDLIVDKRAHVIRDVEAR